MARFLYHTEWNSHYFFFFFQKKKGCGTKSKCRMASVKSEQRTADETSACLNVYFCHLRELYTKFWSKYFWISDACSTVFLHREHMNHRSHNLVPTLQCFCLSFCFDFNYIKTQTGSKIIHGWGWTQHMQRKANNLIFDIHLLHYLLTKTDLKTIF